MHKMNMRPLATAVAAAALTFSTGAAQSQEIASELNDIEKTFWTATEQALSIVAALVDKNGCSNTSYSLSVDVNELNEGTVSLNGGQIAFDVELQTSNGNGTHITTGNVSSTLASPPATDLVGNYYFDGDGGIFYGRADFKLSGTAYDEHIIKDFFKARAFRNKNGVRDEGLEVITKNDFPRAKYMQRSRYLEPNGVDGFMSVNKKRVQFEGTAECEIVIEKTQLFDSNNGLETEGGASIDVIRD